jgi:hypothetical protein
LKTTDVILAISAPPELSITLRYAGKDVDEGTMPIDEVVDSLQGFAGAYLKVASLRDGAIQHQLRVAAIQTGSFDLLIQAWAAAQQTGPVLETAFVSVETARWVVNKITDVIKVKKAH